MKKLIVVACVVAAGGAIIIGGCSQEDREEVMSRVGNAADALKGGDGEKVPAIVKEQQRKERIRQNTQWTPENQALHPVEYCQAQLEELKKCSSKLEVSAHKYAVGQSEAKQKISDCEAQIAAIDEFLVTAKAAYRQADAANKWPVAINGFTLSKEKAQEKIVEAARKLDPLKNQVLSQKNIIAALERRSAKVEAEKRNIVSLRERVQGVISDLNTKKILDGEKGVTDALNAINASMGSLGLDAADPALEDLIAPSVSSSREATFNEIMAE